MDEDGSKPDFNTWIRSHLESLAQLDPYVGPVELCCMWFDDLYTPGYRHPEIFHPGVWDRALRDWEAGFTEHELKVLAEFHKVFDAESEALPIDWPDWDKDAGWLRVREAARHALSEL